MILKRIKNNTGFTLIEVVVAMGVIVTGVLSGLTLTTYNLNVSVASSKTLVAANLAREGLEALREVRDSNWLASQDFSAGILDAGYRLTASFDPEANQFVISSQNNNIDACDNCALYLDKNTGIYSHDNQGTLTSYKRLITLKEICWIDATNQESVLAAGQHCSDSSLDLAGFEAQSVVQWTENSGVRQINEIDKLYDWR